MTSRLAGLCCSAAAGEIQSSWGFWESVGQTPGDPRLKRPTMHVEAISEVLRDAGSIPAASIIHFVGHVG
jgi:hypothetical protein